MGGWGRRSLELLNTGNSLYQKRRRKMVCSQLSLLVLRLKGNLNASGGGLKRIETVKSWWLIYVTVKEEGWWRRCGLWEQVLFEVWVPWRRPIILSYKPGWSLAQRELTVLVFDNLSPSFTGPHCLMNLLPMASLFSTTHPSPTCLRWDDCGSFILIYQKSQLRLTYWSWSPVGLQLM